MREAVVGNDANTSRIRRVTQAALSAEAVIARADDITGNLHVMVEDVSTVIHGLEPSVERLAPALSQLQVVLGKLETQVDGLHDTRSNADLALARANGILDVVEWMLTPAFVARSHFDRIVDALCFARDSMVHHLNRFGPAEPIDEPVARPVQLHLAG